MLRPPLSSIPQAVSRLDCAVTGPAARALLGERRLHLPPELMVGADAESLREAWPALRPDPDRPGRLWAEGWQVVPAPAGVEATLAARPLPVEGVGVRPDGAVIDARGGRAAWSSRRLVVGDIEAAAERDPALPVRALALASELALRVDPSSVAALDAAAGGVFRAERSALRDALTHLLVGRHPAGALQLMGRTRLLAYLLPEVAALVDFHKSSRHHHKDVWHHTRTVVRQALPHPLFRWAALLHDIGKVHTRSFTPDGQVHFFRHEELGAVMFEGVAARLCFPAALAARLRSLILHHLRANLYQPAWTDSAVRRFAREMGDLLPDLLHLSRADVTSRRVGRRREAIANLFALRTRVAALEAADRARQPSAPKGLGTAIIAELGVEPGPAVGDLRRLCEEAIGAGHLPSDADIAACIAWLRERVAA